MSEWKPGSPAGLICRTEQVVTDLSGRHWMTECSEPTIHPMLIEGAIQRRTSADYHATLDCLSVTEVLGKVREAAIKCSLPYWPEAQALNSRAWGTAIGRETERGWQAAGWRTQVGLAGEFWGIPFRGTLDACTVANGIRYIADDKAVAESNMFYERGSFVAKKEFSAQVGMYGQMEPMLNGLVDGDSYDTFHKAWLAATATEGLVWIGAQTRAFDKKSGQMIESWVRKHAEPMTLDEIGAMRCAGSKTSVRENAEILWRFKQRVKAGESAVEALKDVPLACETMYGGACKLYCDANRTCLRLAGVSLASKGIVNVNIPWNDYGMPETSLTTVEPENPHNIRFIRRVQR